MDYQKSGLPDVSMTKLSEEEGYSIYRVQFEILEGLTMTGLFFHADGDEKKPLVILQHGGESAIGWKTVTTYVDSGSEISVNLPDDATYCYASITDNYGDIISTKFMKVQ
ncbi:MAG: hypothetical protein IJC78_00425 [Clostridia bacterium]|nr:hypothetical protein [Clostridia bacterium]